MRQIIPHGITIEEILLSQEFCGISFSGNWKLAIYSPASISISGDRSALIGSALLSARFDDRDIELVFDECAISAAWMDGAVEFFSITTPDGTIFVEN